MITTVILLLMYFCCFVTALSTDNPGFTSFYDTIMNRTWFLDPAVLDKADIHSKVFFFTRMNSWLTTVLCVAAVVIFVNFFMLRFKATFQHVTELTVSLCVSLSFAYYYYVFLVSARYEIVMSSVHIGYFITAGVSLLIAVLKIVLLIRDHNGFEEPLLVFPVCVLMVFVGLFFFSGLKGYGMCKVYSVNYGLYGQEEHVLRTDLEESFMGNFANQAVETDKGLFFLDHEGCSFPISIKKMDSNGEISTVYQETDGRLWTIGYDDGYLFVNRRQSIIKIDPDTGSCEKVIEVEDPEYISDACVVDGKLYYVVFGDNATSIMVCEIDDGELSEAQLYISDINIDETFSYDMDANLLEVYIAGEPAHPRWSGGSWQQRAEGRYRYYVQDGRDEDGNVFPVLVITSDEGFPDRVSHVDAFNIYNGKIYYVLLTDHGFDICRCDLDGSDAEVIDSADLGVDLRDVRTGGMRIMTYQGKILVTGYGMEDLLGTDNDMMYYVTDLV